mmetsp:Transcript_47315/g.107324  ORF Transcript_47315/g.107324 Transcript_47315/m.107324 type:complete len:239 (-) Transcript_47315:506-1222(-)
MQGRDLGTQLVLKLLLHALSMCLVGFAQLRSMTLEISDCARVILLPPGDHFLALDIPLLATPHRISFMCIAQRLQSCGVLRFQRLQTGFCAFKSLRAHSLVADGSTLDPLGSIAMTAGDSLCTLQSILNVLHLRPQLHIFLASCLQTSHKPLRCRRLSLHFFAQPHLRLLQFQLHSLDPAISTDLFGFVLLYASLQIHDAPPKSRLPACRIFFGSLEVMLSFVLCKLPSLRDAARLPT